jgi:hypothetical protein
MPQHATSTSFRPGQIANPGGRPKAATAMTAEARRYAIESIHALVRTMRRAATDQARIAAANALLDRGFGKPTQAVDFTLMKKIGEMSLDELTALEEQITGSVMATAIAPPAGDLFAEIDDAALGERIVLDDPEPIMSEAAR